jgi:hypothetical protein
VTAYDIAAWTDAGDIAAWTDVANTVAGGAAASIG